MGNFRAGLGFDTSSNCRCICRQWPTNAQMTYHIYKRCILYYLDYQINILYHGLVAHCSFYSSTVRVGSWESLVRCSWWFARLVAVQAKNKMSKFQDSWLWGANRDLWQYFNSYQDLSRLLWCDNLVAGQAKDEIWNFYDSCLWGANRDCRQYFNSYRGLPRLLWCDNLDCFRKSGFLSFISFLNEDYLSQPTTQKSIFAFSSHQLAWGASLTWSPLSIH